MRGSDGVRRWAFALALAGVIAGADAAQAQTSLIDAPIEFDIPAQPLDAALNRYGDATGREALYDTSLADGRVSGDVRGMFTPNEALERLLSGTSLSARFVAEDSFVLLPVQPATRQAVPQAPSPAYRRYYGLIQKDLLDALCRSDGTRPGRYRIVAMFWIGSDGAVRKSQRLGTAGTVQADAGIDAALRSVRFREPPPEGFEQPVLILIVPLAPGVTMDCDVSRSRTSPVWTAQ
jgi:hypothetical protein